MKFIIKLKDIKFSAKTEEEAEDVALDIVNDIGHYGDYKVERIQELKAKKQE